MKKYLFLMILICSTVGFIQAQEIVYPAIQGYGGVNEVPFESEKPDPSKHYKLVVELGDRNPDTKKVDDALDYAARMYNLHIYAGIPKENLEVAIILYGGSGPIALNDIEYKKRFEVENPNAELLDEMQKAGIKIVVCGQTMMKQRMLPENLYPGLIPAISRFTAFTDFMQKGYQVIVL